jgi:hypothetical protein
LVLVLLLLRVLEVVGRYDVVAVLTLIWMKFWKHILRNVTRNCLVFIITWVPHVTHTQVHLCLLLIIYITTNCLLCWR